MLILRCEIQANAQKKSSIGSHTNNWMVQQCNLQNTKIWTPRFGLHTSIWRRLEGHSTERTHWAIYVKTCQGNPMHLPIIHTVGWPNMPISGLWVVSRSSTPKNLKWGGSKKKHGRLNRKNHQTHILLVIRGHTWECSPLLIHVGILLSIQSSFQLGMCWLQTIFPACLWCLWSFLGPPIDGNTCTKETRTANPKSQCRAPPWADFVGGSFNTSWKFSWNR
jgi:hypothetical protein